MWVIQVKVQNLWFYYMVSPLWTSIAFESTKFQSQHAAEFELDRLRKDKMKHAADAVVRQYEHHNGHGGPVHHIGYRS